MERILETWVLIDPMCGDETMVAKTHEQEGSLVRQRSSSMTLFERYYGVTRSDHPEMERGTIETIETVLATKPVRPGHSAVTRKAGRLADELENEGTSVGDGDVVIGATAEVAEEAVFTRNVEDFEPIGAGVQTY